MDHRCTGCEFAGFPWGTERPDHCIPSAEQAGHLSRIAYVSRGATSALAQSGIVNLRQLAALTPDASAFDRHQALRAMRTVITERVRSLQAGQGAGPAPDAGGSAMMPRSAQLQIFLTAHFDPSSAVTVAFGLSARYIEPWGRHDERVRAAGGPVVWDRREWRSETWVVPSKDDPTEEERVLLRFLERIHEITQEALALDQGGRRTGIQIYLWDNLELKHLSRVIGRHLEAILANGDTANLAWLFPSDEVVQNARQASRTSPLTVVSDVVRSVLAAPVAHVYSLLPLARAYHPDWTGPAPQPSWWGTYKTHPLFEDPFSDQIPAERIHEIWSRSTRPSWGQQQATLVETIERRLLALQDLTRRLQDDLRPVLRAEAPVRGAEPLGRLGSTSFDGELWYAFAKLNAALEELEVLRVRAMPPHEREARFRSAILERRLTGREEADALQELGLTPGPDRRVYRVSEGSREVRVRENEFNVALAPLSRPTFLDERYRLVVEGTGLAGQLGPNEWKRMEEVCKVDVVAFDRERGNIVLQPGRLTNGGIDDLERAGVVDFSANLTLDPVHADFFTKRLSETLQAIGNPPLALTNPITPRVRQAIGQVRGRGARRGTDSPAAEVLWDAGRLAAACRPASVGAYRRVLDEVNLRLNDSQWDALERSLERTLSVIWGPPGTGKSRTLRAILAVAIFDALSNGRPLRLLLTAGTYTALDTVLLPLMDDLGRLLGDDADFAAHRLRSTLGSEPEDARAHRIDRPINRWNPDIAIIELRRRLHDEAGVTLVAGTPQQVHNLLTTRDDADSSPMQEAFDLIALDEASQVDVALSIMAIAARARDGQVVFAGDHLQLAPVHQAEPPRGLEAMVGSVYAFMVDHHEVAPAMLQVNYRSNQTIVDLAHHAGYRADLRPNSPGLRLCLEGVGCPPGWPASLEWGSQWEELIDPATPAVAFVYPDAQWSSHANEFEADAVAGLSCLLRERLLSRLDGHPAQPDVRARWHDEGFWTRGLGIVTPHRAHVALVLRKLQAAHPGVQASLLRGAVDTVERFQGQERQVIIASYAVGDPDAIRDEEEFLMSLNRFNVMASRAEAKLIVLVPQAVVDHLAGEIEVLRASGLLKTYVATFCRNERPMTLVHARGQVRTPVLGQFRYA